MEFEREFKTNCNKTYYEFQTDKQKAEPRTPIICPACSFGIRWIDINIVSWNHVNNTTDCRIECSQCFTVNFLRWHGILIIPGALPSDTEKKINKIELN